MTPNFNNSKVIFLHPGEVIFSKKPMIVATILGSCVSITFYNKRTKIAGISHCQLPKCKGPHTGCEECEDPYKYVDCTIRKMLEKFMSLKINKDEIEVKIFGGGDVLNKSNSLVKSKTVGRQNIDAAIRTVQKSNLNLVAMDVGGKTGRKIFFLTGIGEIYLNRLKNNEEN